MRCRISSDVGSISRVCSISMSPVNSTFLTGSFDETVLFWDLRTDRAMVSFPVIRLLSLAEFSSVLQGKLKNMDGHCLTAWDGTGKIFAVAVPQKQIISLYSVDAFDKVSFSLFDWIAHRTDWFIETVRMGDDRRPRTG
jgi:COMPASS component SWD2